MTRLLVYIASSALCLALFWGAYRLFLRRETFFRLNRLFLLGAGAVALVAPLIPWPIASAVSPTLAIFLQPVLTTPAGSILPASGPLRWTEIAAIVWGTGASIFFLRFLVQVFQLLRMSKKPGTEINGIRVVPAERGYSPFSFFRVVFLNTDGLDPDQLGLILQHERVHIRQGHTWDLLAAGLLTSVQWFNPCAWLAVRDLKTLHEYLADEGVLRAGAEPSEYSQLILGEILGVRISGLASNFNIHLLKNRIAMMTTRRSSVWSRTKFLTLIPSSALALSILFAGASFTAPQEVKKTAAKDSAYVAVENMPTYPGGQQAMGNFFVTNIKYPKEAMQKKIQGKVFVQFIITKDGSVSDVKVVRGIGGGCDEEAVRVVKMMPKWTPGTEKGKPVDVIFNLPVQFALQEKEKGKK